MQYQRLTWGSIRPTIEKVLNLCSGDARALDFCNRACQRLLEEGKWVGTMARYRFCAENSCIVLPRQLETVEAFAICSTPMPFHSAWFEFLGNGTYLQDGDSCSSGWGCGTSAIDRDEVGSFDNVIGADKKLAVLCDVAEDAGAYITLQYYNDSAQWVRTQVGAEWIDGERVTFGAVGQYVPTASEVMASGFVRAIKPVTKGMVRLYELNTGVTPNTYRPLAYFEPDETIPVYRRIQIPGIGVSSSDDCQKTSVTIIAKKRFIPVAKDDDFLSISHPEAIRMGVQSIWKSENNMPAEASIYMNGGIDPITRNRIEGAIPVLQAQLRQYRGAGTVAPMKMIGAETFGAGGIPSLI